MATKEKIIAEITSYLQTSNYTGFYIGITNDVERRLFEEHKVSPKNGCWIYIEADSKSIAQDVEEYFLNEGMQGDTGGGNDDSTYVYCYQITSYTVE